MTFSYLWITSAPHIKIKPREETYESDDSYFMVITSVCFVLLENSGVVMCTHVHGNISVYHSNVKTLVVPFFTECICNLITSFSVSSPEYSWLFFFVS